MKRVKTLTYKLTPAVQSKMWFVYRDGIAYIDLPQYAIYAFLKLELDMVADMVYMPHLDIPEQIAGNKDFTDTHLEKFMSGFYNVDLRPTIKHIQHFDESLEEHSQKGILRLTYHEPFLTHYLKNLSQ